MYLREEKYIRREENEENFFNIFYAIISITIKLWFRKKYSEIEEWWNLLQFEIEFFSKEKRLTELPWRAIKQISNVVYRLVQASLLRN